MPFSMHLVPTGELTLGLLLFIARCDSRLIKSVELVVDNTTGKQLSIMSMLICDKAQAEAKIVMENGIFFLVKIEIDRDNWENFIRTFFLDEVPMISTGLTKLRYINGYAYEIKCGFGLVND